MEGKLGLLNSSREPLSEFIYDDIKMLGNDIIKARINGMLHLFNCEGNLITPIKYKDVVVYYNPDLKGRYFVKDADGKVGMIDDEGNVLIPNEFERLDPISHHKQVYGRKKNKIFHYDYNGNLVYLKEIR